MNEEERPSSRGWFEQWSDPALQHLGHWLWEHGIAAPKAAMVMETLWAFYSYEVLPMVQERVPLGIGARKDSAGEVVLSLFLPSRGLPSAPQKGTEQRTEPAILGEFKTEVINRLAPEIRADLQAVSGNTDFESLVHQYCERLDLEYVGVFVDNLEEELKKIIPAETLDAWLDSPNSRFGGRPRTLLEPVQHSRALRDLILSVKHGAVS